MTESNLATQLADLPQEVQATLLDLVPRIIEAIPGVSSIVLFGSAAEGRMRQVSDVNLVVMAQHFNQGFEKIHRDLNLAHAATQIKIMFLADAELARASELFAVKFQDIKRRHRVLSGVDPFVNLEINRSAIAFRLRQTLMNLILRHRALFAMNGHQADRLTRTIAEIAGPLRSIAAAFMSLQGKDLSPRQALIELAATMDASFAVSQISNAREKQGLDLTTASKTHSELLVLAEKLLLRVEAL